MHENRQLDTASVREFIRRHRLPDAYESAIDSYFLPLADWLGKRRRPGVPLVLGINGAQGTGKSTLGDFLALACREQHGWTSAVLSIDDFYLKRAEREDLARRRNPLLMTRGVPGTHDTALLGKALDRLVALAPGETFAPPRFDKSIDDRAAPPWPIVAGPVDLVVLEGWCVGTEPETPEALEDPVNALEREQDTGGEWRTWVNKRLEDEYCDLWSRLDALVFLRAPDFEAIYAWRLEQEHKLKARVGKDAEGVMSDAEVRDFIDYYERLTRHNLATLDTTADVVFDLDENHAIVSARYS